MTEVLGNEGFEHLQQEIFVDLELGTEGQLRQLKWMVVSLYPASCSMNIYLRLSMSGF